MEVYKYINLDNGDILLEKLLLDNNNFTIINKDNGDILLKKNTSINITTVSNLKLYDFKKSTILNCTINNINDIKLKYKSLLEYIYELINDGTKIIKNTKINIKTIKKEDEGFYYIPNLGISVQGVESNKCLLEIINQCIENEITISIQIKLKNNLICILEFLYFLF